jgi:starch synthase
LLSWVAAKLAVGDIDPRWRADIVHGHDWHAGLCPVYLRSDRQSPVPGCLFTIHNLAFQGLFDPVVLEQLQLNHALYTPDGIEFYGQLSFMKAGLRYADRISTVSPRYAQEIQTPEFGCGLDGLLRARHGDLSGILNGVDRSVWDPASDALLAEHYSAEEPGAKARLKAALQREFGLAERPDAIVIGVVSRLTEQKGIDLLAQALTVVREIGGQLTLLGEGDAATERGLQAAAAANRSAISVRFGYDEGLAHRIVAGADVIAVPSRFEPCGLTQLYALRYGALPLVRRVGGLADTVVDATPGAVEADTATGFVFNEPSVAAVSDALRRIGDAWRDREAWTRLMRRAMAQDFSWERSAAAYLRLYDELLHPGSGADNG